MKKGPPAIRDGNFLEIELHRESEDDCHINLVYLESPKKRVTILTEKYASKDQLRDAFINNTDALCVRARALCPAIGTREEHNLTMMKDLPFKPIDVRCDYCGSRPGEACPTSDHAKECLEDRENGLRHFLIWLAEQKFPETKKLTKARLRAVLDGMGIEVHRQNSWANPYDSTSGLAIQHPHTGVYWCLYIGGRVDSTHSAWMTCGMNFSNPECGPFRNEREIALALSKWGRCR